MLYYEKFVSRAKNIGLKQALQDSLLFVFNQLKTRGRLRPYAYIQAEVQENLHKYLQVSKESIKRILVIGAHLGFEVSDMLKQHKSCSFLLFEGSPRYSKVLTQKFSHQDRVQIYECLIGDVDSQIEFFETNVEGTGSILKPDSSSNINETQSYFIPCFRLDTHAKENGYNNQLIDCLWIDVQGAEKLVLNGATETLKNIKSIFIEVSIYQEQYIGAVKMAELSQLLEKNHFQIFALGTDSSNGTGNAFYVNMSLVNFIEPANES